MAPQQAAQSSPPSSPNGSSHKSSTTPSFESSTFQSPPASSTYSSAGKSGGASFARTTNGQFQGTTFQNSGSLYSTAQPPSSALSYAKESSNQGSFTGSATQQQLSASPYKTFYTQKQSLPVQRSKLSPASGQANSLPAKNTGTSAPEASSLASPMSSARQTYQFIDELTVRKPPAPPPRGLPVSASPNREFPRVPRPAPAAAPKPDPRVVPKARSAPSPASKIEPKV